MNYNKAYNAQKKKFENKAKEFKEKFEGEVEEIKEKEEAFTEAEEIKEIGKISGAEEVYVRMGPSKEVEHITTAKKNDEVQIVDKSDDEWYKVCLPSGIEGYVMKQFVTV